MFHIFSLTGIIVKFTGIDVVIPLAGFIQQLHCIGEIECGIMTIRRHHRTGPGMFELYPALRMMETDSGRVAMQFHRLDTEKSYAPHLMQHHFGTGSFQYLLHRSRGNP